MKLEKRQVEDFAMIVWSNEQGWNEKL